MRFSGQDFTEQYRGMSDSELLALERTELNEVARQCYDGELARRGLTLETAPPPAEEPESLPGDLPPDGDVMLEQPPGEAVEEDLAPAAIYASRNEAQAARGLLQAAAIPAFLENAALGTDGAPRNPLGDWRLLVPASYLDEARELLSPPA